MHNLNTCKSIFILFFGNMSIGHDDLEFVNFIEGSLKQTFNHE